MLKQLVVNIQTKLDNKAFNNISLRAQIVLLLWWHCKKNVKCKDEAVAQSLPTVVKINFNSRAEKQI